MLARARSTDLYLIQGGLETSYDYSRFGLLRFLDEKGLQSMLNCLSRRLPDDDWELLQVFATTYTNAERNPMRTVNPESGAYAKKGAVRVALQDKACTFNTQMTPKEAKHFALDLLRAALDAEKQSK